MLQQIGINTFFTGKGIQAANLNGIVSFPGVYVNGVGLKPIQQPRFYEPYINDSIADGVTVELAAGDSEQYQILKYLSVWCDHDGELDFYMGPVNYLPVFMLANTQQFIPLPTEGLISEADNQDFKLTNNTGATISVLVAFSVVNFIIAAE